MDNVRPGTACERSEEAKNFFYYVVRWEGEGAWPSGGRGFVLALRASWEGNVPALRAGFRHTMQRQTCQNRPSPTRKVDDVTIDRFPPNP